tara:strand:+ start:311 stop:499 length:189 start_codon:yes stop_codon:yes gene_type:complete
MGLLIRAYSKPITGDIVNKQLQAELLVILEYVLESEATHYEECEMPENHIYALALKAIENIS